MAQIPYPLPLPTENDTKMAPYMDGVLGNGIEGISKYYKWDASTQSTLYGVVYASIYVNMGDTITFDKLTQIFEQGQGYHHLTNMEGAIITEFWYHYYQNPIRFMGKDKIIIDERITNEQYYTTGNKYNLLSVFFFYDEDEYIYEHKAQYVFQLKLVLNDGGGSGGTEGGGTEGGGTEGGGSGGTEGGGTEGGGSGGTETETPKGEVKQLNYCISNNTIIFEDTVQHFQLYNTHGKLVTQDRNVNQVALPSIPNVYIIKVDGKTIKIVI